MSETVSFVARDDLADWLESRADAEMKTVSSLVQDIVAAEYRRQRGDESGKSGQTGEGEPEPLPAMRGFEFPKKQQADAVRGEFSEYVSDTDDARLKEVRFEAGTPAEVVKELERRSKG